MAQTKTTLQENVTSPVVISEVMYLSPGKDKEWVELLNISEREVDLKGWRLTDGQSLEVILSAKSLKLSPHGFVVVRLDGLATQIPTTSKDKVVTIHSPTEVKGDVLGNNGGHLALYNDKDPDDDDYKIQSYVAWGYSPGWVVQDAIDAGLLTRTRSAVSGTNPMLVASGTVKGIQLGGSIGIINLSPDSLHESDWGVFNSAEISPGKPNSGRRVPLLAFPYGNKTDENGMTTLSVVPMADALKYQFQVCLDKECKNVFLDMSSNYDNYELQKPIPRNTMYYWRARVMYKDGTFSAWSETRDLRNGYPK